MTWAKIHDGFNDDPDLLALSRGARLLYVEAIVWSCKHLKDGELPEHVIPRITDEPKLSRAIAELEAAGLWQRTETGWQITDYLKYQDSRAKITKLRDDERLRKERNRKHQAGDHTACIRGRFCPRGALLPDGTPLSDDPWSGTPDVTRDRTRDRTRDGRDPHQTSPSPLPSVGRGSGEEGDGTCPHGDPVGLLATKAGTPRCAECRRNLASTSTSQSSATTRAAS